ncbi:ABC transporter ATP-binding protein [Caldalkalibacillus salinus]|uniref:ABC transporter ATP-binding protein n=1 Tax=Caldalkalibacillus salinus TaxID=2803787 RepID=UPI001921277C|nr:ABC transporter ATP-binding protein [Caldalkalibacillus salinus]
MSSIIRVHDVRKKYEDLQAVNGVSFEVKKGEIFGLLGPNGAGKTTTLEMMEGLRKIDEGEVYISGYSVEQYRQKIRTMIGIQLQSTSLFDLLTVEETLHLYASFYQATLGVGDVLSQMNLVEKKASLVKSLSGGQKQRLAIGLALIHDPDVIFLDEPTTGLDPQARRALWDIIQDLQNRGKTILLSTHYMEEAHELCDRLAIMDQGQLKALDTPDQLIEELNMDSAVAFTWSEERYPSDEIAGVVNATYKDGKVVLYTKDLQQTLISLIKWSEKNQKHLLELQTRKATLEDVFLHLTGRSLRD